MFGLFKCLMFMIGLVQLLLGPVLDLVMSEFALSKAQAGFLSTAYILGNVPGMLLSGRLKPGAINVACSGAALCLCAVAAAPSVRLLSLGLFGTGFACGFLFSAMAAVAAAGCTSQQKAARLNGLYAWLGVGVVLAPLYSSLWQRQGLWRQIPAGYGVLFVLLALFFPHQSFQGPSLKLKIPKRGNFALICLALCCYVASESAVSIWLVKYLQDQFSLAGSNYVLAGMWLNISLGRFILAKTQFSDRKTLLALTLWSTCFIVSAAFSAEIISVLSFLAIGLGFSGR